MGVGGADHHRSEPTQFLLEQAGGPVAGEGPEAVAAHQLGTFAAVVGGGAPHRAHLDQLDRQAGRRDLPGGLGAGQAGADDPDHQARERLIISWSWPTAARPMWKTAQLAGQEDRSNDEQQPEIHGDVMTRERMGGS